MRPILRSLVEAQSRCAYALGPRMMIGRAPSANVQLVHQAVSRHHAVIERESDGSHVITDLASKAGTRVDGSTVQQAVLYVGAVIDICGFRLRFEVSSDPAAEESSDKVRSELTMRPTATEHAAVVEPAGRKRISNTQILADDALLDVPHDDGWRSVVRDIVGVRGIDGDAPASPRARFLAARFDESAAHASGSRRRSRRHRIETHVRIGVLGRAGGSSVPGHMVDASATGAKLRTDAVLPIGGLCWVLVATGESEHGGVALTARVVWTDIERKLIGVTFVGKAMSGSDVLPPGDV